MPRRIALRPSAPKHPVFPGTMKRCTFPRRRVIRSSSRRGVQRSVWTGVNIPSLEWGNGENLMASLDAAIRSWQVNIIRLPVIRRKVDSGYLSGSIRLRPGHRETFWCAMPERVVMSLPMPCALFRDRTVRIFSEHSSPGKIGEACFPVKPCFVDVSYP